MFEFYFIFDYLAWLLSKPDNTIKYCHIHTIKYFGNQYILSVNIVYIIK